MLDLVLGRCHAAKGEHALSCAALDSALELTSVPFFLLSEALTVRARAQVGGGSGAGEPGGVHWGTYTGEQRKAEVAGRRSRSA